jgi:hypothetical protein
MTTLNGDSSPRFTGICRKKRGGKHKAALPLQPRHKTSAHPLSLSIRSLPGISSGCCANRASQILREVSLGCRDGCFHAWLQTTATAYACAANVAARGQKVLTGGDIKRPAVGERHNLLEDAFPEGFAANKRCSFAVL